MNATSSRSHAIFTVSVEMNELKNDSSNNNDENDYLNNSDDD